jgi:hypothetical protein
MLATIIQIVYLILLDEALFLVGSSRFKVALDPSIKRIAIDLVYKLTCSTDQREVC